MEQNDAAKALSMDIRRRLRRIEGQLKGIERMVNQEAGCLDILIQVSAVRAAISRVGVIILERHIKECLTQTLQANNAEKEKALDELISILNSYLK